MARTFYRIVKTDPATVADFTSAQAKGRRIPANLPQHLRRLWDGLSAYETRRQAERMARQSPMIGSYVAELQIPDDAPIRSERTTRDSGHYTLWGEPHEFLRYVTTIQPVTGTVQGRGRRR